MVPRKPGWAQVRNPIDGQANRRANLPSAGACLSTPRQTEFACDVLIQLRDKIGIPPFPAAQLATGRNGVHSVPERLPGIKLPPARRANMGFLRPLCSAFDVGEIETPSGRAIVEERYSALRRQIPIIYLLAVVNLCGLELATAGKLSPGLNFPTALCAFAVARIAQWFRTRTDVTHEAMLHRLRQTRWIAAALSLVILGWCLHLAEGGGSAVRMPVMLFGGFTAIGAAYGLSSVPSAARILLLMLALPLAAKGLLSNEPQFMGAAMSLAVVALLILRLLSVHSSHFTDLVASRSTIARQQELAENAHLEATIAATTDFLTGPNRRAFVAAIEAEIEESSEGGFPVAIVDLDRFKAVNDTFGHGSGDELLKKVAARLLRAAGQNGLVARLGGDEFGMLLPGITTPEAAAAAGARILAEVNRSATANRRKFAVSACCGFGLSDKKRTENASRILADADIALYQAKGEAPGLVSVFEPDMEAPQRRRAQIERALQLPSFRKKVGLVYQPIIDLRTGALIANEALARWHDAELGAVSPAEFIPIAEQLHVIGDLNNRLLSEALAEAVQWPASVRLSFNLSAVQLCSEGSAEAILEALREAQLPPERFQAEVTETTLLADFGRARANLAALRDAGVVIALDDFGAGYASIGYLREMRFDQIKLDGALVTAAQTSSDGERLLGAVIGLCLALGVSPVAEHIENEQQLKLLLSLGCSAGQGHWLQAPVPAAIAQEISRTASLAAQAPRGRFRQSAA